MMNPFTGEVEQTNTNQLMTLDGIDFVRDLQMASKALCSLVPHTPQEQAALFKAANNPDKRLSEMINLKIMVKDVYVEQVTVKDQNGMDTICPRIVFIDDQLVGYQCVSLGIFGALKKLFQIYGTPTWEEPLPIVVRQIKKGEKSLLTIDIEY